MDIISREDAKQNNKPHFFTGTACKHGHFSFRYVNDGTCVSCRRERTAHWMRENRQRFRDYKKDWKLKNRENVISQRRHYRKETDRVSDKKYESTQRARCEIDLVFWAKKKLSAIKTRSKADGIYVDPNLTPEYLASLVPIDKICPALGTKMLFGAGRDQMNASIDRINPGLGYQKGNLAVISKRANSIKLDSLDSDELRRVASYMDLFMKKGNHD